MCNLLENIWSVSNDCCCWDKDDTGYQTQRRSIDFILNIQTNTGVTKGSYRRIVLFFWQENHGRENRLKKKKKKLCQQSWTHVLFLLFLKKFMYEMRTATVGTSCKQKTEIAYSGTTQHRTSREKKNLEGYLILPSVV